MVEIVMSIYDKKAEYFLRPFFVRTVAVGYRDMIAEVRRGGETNLLASNPGDFEVWQLGVFDPESGFMDFSGEKGKERYPLKLADLSTLIAASEVSAE